MQASAVHFGSTGACPIVPENDGGSRWHGVGRSRRAGSARPRGPCPPACQVKTGFFTMPELAATSTAIDSVSSYRELPLFFASASGALYGVFYAPDVGGRQDRVLVFCHSLGIEHMVTQRMEVLGARAAAKAGFTAFRYNSRAHGDSAGDPKDITFTDLVDDACAAADQARE